MNPLKTSLFIFVSIICSMLIVYAIVNVLLAIHTSVGVGAAMSVFVVLVGLLSLGLGYAATKGFTK